MRRLVNRWSSRVNDDSEMRSSHKAQEDSKGYLMIYITHLYYTVNLLILCAFLNSSSFFSHMWPRRLFLFVSSAGFVFGYWPHLFIAAMHNLACSNIIKEGCELTFGSMWLNSYRTGGRVWSSDVDKVCLLFAAY